MGLYVTYSDDKGTCLRTSEPIRKGEVAVEMVGNLLGEEAAGPKSLQISDKLWLESSPEMIDNNVNHSCSPNCKIVFINLRVYLIALRNIGFDEELTFNYNTTELDFEGFECHCGSPNCTRWISGAANLSDVDRDKIKDMMLPYLAKKWV
jgi:uncharacterized protein